MANRAGIEARLAELTADFMTAYTKLQIEAQTQELTDLEHQLNQPAIWNDPIKAQALAKTVASKQEFLQPWQAMKLQLEDYRELLAIDDQSWLAEVERQIDSLASQLAELKRALSFNGKHDSSDVILRLTSGVGGLDAQDFTEMLERMYLRWLQNQHFTVNLIERQTSDEANMASTVWCALVRLTLIICVRLVLHWWRFCQKSSQISSKLPKLTSKLIIIALVAMVVRVSILPIARCGLLICRLV